MYYAIGASVSSLHRESTDSPIIGPKTFVHYREVSLTEGASEVHREMVGTCKKCPLFCRCPLLRGVF